MTHWTPADVEARLSEAGMILRRLPEPRRNGYFSTWPEIVHGFADKVGQEPKPMRVSPSPRDIARMEETLTWTNCLEPIDGKIVWMKAHDERWKNICWHVGLCHAAAHQHWRYGLSLIALNLNRQPFNRKLPILEIIKLARSL
ncbi:MULTISPECIES: DUF6362 family protein [Rhodobacterales]|jgi:hypothetical protein|uniref:DUF6362 domain-containing protein n=4 Tax=Rhodobacterales TaxID=204455 RepID=A0A238K3U1_9RHOB|nr:MULTISPECIES: DUF6362 family protein [Rhodobacterales]KGJ07127.1 hypothetical protein IC63_09250 [Paracoccus sphaerophysae]MCT4332824.1 DUF6362 family protein [Paracoccus sp. YLB-12]GGE39325.1 hypothetical protein GCM10011360_28770 [Primorskyibacter flagellatus]SMX37601.1 hypothetical protein MAA8898_01199 [Maliponia aquimaris]